MFARVISFRTMMRVKSLCTHFSLHPAYDVVLFKTVVAASSLSM